MFYLPFAPSYSSTIQLFRSSSNFLFSLHHHHHNHHISILFPPLPPPHNRPFPSSFGPLFQNEGRCSAFDMEIIFHSHSNKTYFRKKCCAPSLIWKRGFLELESALLDSIAFYSCIKTERFNFTGVHAFLRKLMRFLDKKGVQPFPTILLVKDCTMI